MKLRLTTVACLLLALTACTAQVGCALAPHIIEGDSYTAQTVNVVIDRHDEYVNGDIDLDDAERRHFLGETTAVRATLALPEIDAKVLAGQMTEIMNRHDAYVGSDPQYDGDDEYLRNIALKDTEVLRGFFEEVAFE